MPSFLLFYTLIVHCLGFIIVLWKECGIAIYSKLRFYGNESHKNVRRLAHNLGIGRTVLCAMLKHLRRSLFKCFKSANRGFKITRR
jgi:hypothetical protein